MIEENRIYDYARRMVGTFAIFSANDQYILAEEMLSDLGFEELLCALKAIRFIKSTYGAVDSSNQIKSEIIRMFNFNESIALRTLEDIRLGAIKDLAPFSCDPLDAMLSFNSECEENYSYTRLFYEWLQEPHAYAKLVDLICRPPAAKQIARELIFHHGALPMYFEAWPSEYWDRDDDPVLLAIRPERDHGLNGDLLLLRPRSSGQRPRVFVICDGREVDKREAVKNGDVVLQFSPAQIANNPEKCAALALKALPSPSIRHRP